MADQDEAAHLPKHLPDADVREEKYDSSKIDKLEGLAGVRQRPGMYIGPTDERGLHHCVFEVLDNSIDEHLAGYCSRIDVALHIDGSCSIRDNGRGIPVDIHPKFEHSRHRAGAHESPRRRQIRPGRLQVLRRPPRRRRQVRQCPLRLVQGRGLARWQGLPHGLCQRGETTQKLIVIGDLKSKKQTGTLITFLPDPTIFTITTEFQFAKLACRLRELAFLNPGLEINLVDERADPARKEQYYL